MQSSDLLNEGGSVANAHIGHNGREKNTLRSNNPLRHRRGLLRRGYGVVAAIAASLMVVSSITIASSVATAAPGDLDATVQWVETATGQPFTDLTATTDSRSTPDLALVTLRIGYSCGPVDCLDTVVHLDPMQLDPFYNSKRFASYSSGSLPSGATMAGNANLGWDFNLGDLAPGSSGSFDLLFNYQSRPGGSSPQSFFPEGAQIEAKVTASATGIDPVSNTHTVTWHLETPAPRVGLTVGDTPVALPIARVGQPYDYTLFMSASCQWERSTAAHGEPAYECAESYTAKQTLPAGVQFVSATHGGVYDAGSHTVTWSDSGLTAATGWGALGNNGTPRTVTVIFPEEMFTSECVIDAASTLEVDMTYLSGAQKSATSTRSVEANSCPPFADVVFTKSTTRNSGSAAEPIVWEGQNNYWAVDISNRSNVPTVSIITEIFDQAGLPVNRIVSTGGAAHLLLMLDDGTSVDTTTADYKAPIGRNIVSATVTTPELAGPNKQAGSTPLVNTQRVRFYYTPSEGVPTQGFERTNTAQVTATFPGTAELSDLDLGTDSETVFVTQRPPTISPSLGATVVGGGNPVPGQIVNFTMRGTTKDMKPDVPFEPQYVFAAPFGWDLIPGSAVLAGTPDAVYEYKTVVINGETRQAVYVHRPAGTVWGVNATMPTMTVQATPTNVLPANTVSSSTFFLGDAAHNYSRASALWGSSRIDDTPDLDGDGVTTETFTYASVNHRVGASSGLSLLKEICVPDATQADGCDWQANPNVPAKVSPDTADILYRVTITNSGSSTLSNIVGYDVLPYPGDTGVTPGAGPRGSTFTEKLMSVPSNTGVNLTFSGSTNPCRPEVNASAAGCVDDWGTTAAGAQAIRIAVPGSLAGGASVSFSYLAEVADTPEANSLACNSVAVVSDSTPVTEPRPVCALIEEADLEVTSPGNVSTQQARPTVIPFTFANNGGNAESPATVTLDIPVGVTVSNLDYSGWECAAASAAPVAGPAEILCEPVGGLLVMGTPLELNLEVLVFEPVVTVTSTIDGPMFDSEPGNNTQAVVIMASSEAFALGVTKTDGVTSTRAGDELTYTITVLNPLDFEGLADVAVVDTLPLGVEFISASDSGAYDSADHTVTWTLDSIAAAGSAEVTVTVLVLDTAGSEITNTVNASAADPAFPGDTFDGTATDTDTVESILLTKTGALDNTGAAPVPGDTVTYTLTATNTGGGALTDVEITDLLPGMSGFTVVAWPSVIGELAPGESVTATAVYTLTQADIDAGEIINDAHVAAQTVESQEVISAAQHTQVLSSDAAIALTKSAGSVDSSAGGTTVFEFVAVNNSNVTLHNVAITDALSGVSALTYTWPAAAGVLAPGESVTATASYTATQSDINTGSLENTATVTAETPAGDPVSDDSTVTVPFAQNPVLTLNKQGSVADPDNVAIGEEITFTFVVENTGNVTVTDITISDALAGMSSISYTWPGATGTLAPGESMTATAVYPVTLADLNQGSVDNTATVTGTAPGGSPTATDSVTVPIAGVPQIAITKTGSLPTSGTVYAGEVITYTFNVQNTGVVTLYGVSVADSLPGLSTITYVWPGTAGQLEPGESVIATATYALTQADLDAGYTVNTATASGTSGAGTTVSAIDTEMMFSDSVPVIEITKNADLAAGERSIGDIVSYSFVVENLGNITLGDVTIVDALAGLSSISYGTWPSAAEVLAPGESVTATATYALTQADLDAGRVDNTAIASAEAVRGGFTLDSGTANVEFPVAASIALVKTAELDEAIDPRAGDTVTYSFEVSNTGQATLENISISDVLPGISAVTYGTWPGDTGTLAPGESVTATAEYTLTQADVDAGEITNDATVTATTQRGATATSTDSVTTPLASNPSLGFLKNVELSSTERPMAGQQARFTFEFTNTGNVTLTNLSIQDELEGLSAINIQWPGATGELAPGQSATAIATYNLTQVDIDAGVLFNEALVSGTPPTGDAIETRAEVSVPLESGPALELVKTASLDDVNEDGYANGGEELVYTFVVTNTGNVTVHDINIDDPMLGGVISVGTLAPGESFIVDADPYTVTDEDAARGEIVNRATAVGVSPTDEPVASWEAEAVVVSLEIIVPDDPAGETPQMAYTGVEITTGVLTGVLFLALGGLFLMYRRKEDVKA